MRPVSKRRTRQRLVEPRTSSGFTHCPKAERVEIANRIAGGEGVEIQAASKAGWVSIDEAADIRIVIPRPHIEQSVRVGHDTVAAIVEERSVVRAEAVCGEAVRAVLDSICGHSIGVSQGDGAAAKVAV